jgi:hypothetical protein
MAMVLLSVVLTILLGWSMARLERDSLTRLPVMAALAMSTVWALWSLVSIAPTGSAASLHAAAAAGTDPLGFWGRLAQPGLTGTRISALLFVSSLVLALWPSAGVLGRVVRAAIVSALRFLCCLWGLGLAFVLFWSSGAEARAWNAEITLTALSFVLVCVAVVRQGISTGILTLPGE